MTIRKSKKQVPAIVPTARSIEGSIFGTVLDPLLPKTPVSIKGKVYNLCFTFGALAIAEHYINRALTESGISERVDLLDKLVNMDMLNTCILFAAGIHQFHPEVRFEDACRMVDYENVLPIQKAIGDAFVASMPTPQESGDPQLPSK